jgi:hypothetical protein
VPGRACGSCTLCCKTVAVAELAKPAGTPCQHCRLAKGCAIYEARPAGCRDFYCEWMLSEKFGREWRPDRARFALLVTHTGHLSVAADPDYPSAWRRAPYHRVLRRWARERAEDPETAWPAVDVWIGQRCIIILPDGEKDLGIVAADEEVRIDQAMTDTGPVYRATKFSESDAGARRSADVPAGWRHRLGPLGGWLGKFKAGHRRQAGLLDDSPPHG